MSESKTQNSSSLIEKEHKNQTEQENINIDKDNEKIYKIVSNYYGKVLQNKNDLKSNICCNADKPSETILNILKLVPNEIKERYYGCGINLPFGIKNLTILDLGSGSGQDCYVASYLNGESGEVIGIDMTLEQIQVANKYVEYYCKQQLKYSKNNIRFIHGYIELLSSYLKHESVDVIISNCVVNLSPNKEQVLKEIWKVLKNGGEFYFSDVYCDRRLPNDVQNNEILIGECIGGALYYEDFRRMCLKIGFNEIRTLKSNELKIGNECISNVVGNAKFYSTTYRLFKIPELEDKCEDYGQVGIYKGTIDFFPNFYKLDSHHTFITNKPMLICKNTQLILTKSWLKEHFNVIGNDNVHYGLFPCGDKNDQKGTSNNDISSSSSSSSSCCN